MFGTFYIFKTGHAQKGHMPNVYDLNIQSINFRQHTVIQLSQACFHATSEKIKKNMLGLSGNCMSIVAKHRHDF